MVNGWTLTTSAMVSFHHKKHHYIIIILSVANEKKEEDGTELDTVMTKEDETILNEVKSSFPCWLGEDSKQSFMKRTDWILAISKFVITILFVLLLTLAVGLFIRQAKNISIWVLKQDGHFHPETNATLI